MRTAPLVLTCALVAVASCSDEGASTTTASPVSVAPSSTTERTATIGSAASSSAATSPTAVPSATDTAGDRPGEDEAPQGYPPQPGGVPFPDGEWPTAPVPAHVDQARLEAAVGAAFAPGSGVRSLVVVHGGAIVYERYDAESGPDTIMSSFSVAKSFTATLIGLLVEDGLLDLDEPVARPEWPAGDPRHGITLRQLLQMSSGLQWDEAVSLMTMGPSMLSSPSAAAVMAQQPLERDPGSAFEYSTGTTALVAGIAAEALGGCAALDAYLRERLLDPIGITTAQIMTDAGGCFVGGFGLDMTSRDFARFGLLNLRGGRWDGQQVVPARWIDAERTPSPTNPQYGLHWWLGSPNRFLAVGLGGQQVAIIPAADLVIVVNTAIGSDAVSAGLVSEVAAAFGAPA
jgi:CubicO group peptidase (beta-lactamase class C family)